MSIKPIETYYNGYRFRSRLEARWAVFFDEVGIKYQYEPEGFVLSDGTYYLPDFYLPDLRLWVEVKGVMDMESKKKINLFSEELNWTDSRLWILGDIPKPFDNTYELYDEEFVEDAFWVFAKEAADGPYLPCICPACGRVGVEFDGRGWRVDDCTEQDTPLVFPEAGSLHHEDKGYSFHAPIIQNAYKKARQARFEHGEKP